ncbi:MAG: tRNA (guanosine(37)-N1)-methyltransferase TrmD [Clostridiales bacterium]|nr:tRNA (guanosine(37)-N1)-methyltransferase TrmD [Clostridiales bacterium]
MKIDILTLFPEMFGAIKESILGKALDKGLFELNLINIRDFSLEKHKKVDDYIFGGGDGMLMTPQPLYDAIMSVKTDNSYVVYMSPKGTVLTQSKVKSMALNYDHLIIVCGHYEGIDQRVIDLCIDEQISIGDYVLTGGELPAMVLVDTIARFIPNVLHSETSTSDESFEDGLLEYPQYTRPREFMGLSVPDVLLNGNHKEIEKWKLEQKVIETKKYRPDLIDKEN